MKINNNKEKAMFKQSKILFVELKKNNKKKIKRGQRNIKNYEQKI